VIHFEFELSSRLFDLAWRGGTVETDPEKNIEYANLGSLIS
jgi:hypothetical protein